jgi:hypothetical protein
MTEATFQARPAVSLLQLGSLDEAVRAYAMTLVEEICHACTYINAQLLVNWKHLLRFMISVALYELGCRVDKCAS